MFSLPPAAWRLQRARRLPRLPRGQSGNVYRHRKVYAVQEVEAYTELFFAARATRMKRVVRGVPRTPYVHTIWRLMPSSPPPPPPPQRRQWCVRASYTLLSVAVTYAAIAVMMLMMFAYRCLSHGEKGQRKAQQRLFWLAVHGAMSTRMPLFQKVRYVVIARCSGFRRAYVLSMRLRRVCAPSHQQVPLLSAFAKIQRRYFREGRRANMK